MKIQIEESGNEPCHPEKFPVGTIFASALRKVIYKKIGDDDYVAIASGHEGDIPITGVLHNDQFGPVNRKIEITSIEAKWL